MTDNYWHTLHCSLQYTCILHLSVHAVHSAVSKCFAQSYLPRRDYSTRWRFWQENCQQRWRTGFTEIHWRRQLCWHLSYEESRQMTRQGGYSRNIQLHNYLLYIVFKLFLSLIISFELWLIMLNTGHELSNHLFYQFI